MRRPVLRRISHILAWVLGMSGCGSTVTPLYGMLSTSFDLDGKVIRDGTSTTIPGIEVDFEGNADTTDANGEWSLSEVWAADCGSDCRLTARDIDGGENGNYRDTEVRFTATRPSDSDETENTSAFVVRDIEIEMSPSNDDPNN